MLLLPPQGVGGAAELSHACHRRQGRGPACCPPTPLGAARGPGRPRFRASSPNWVVGRANWGADLAGEVGNTARKAGNTPTAVDDLALADGCLPPVAPIPPPNCRAPPPLTTHGTAQQADSRLSSSLRPPRFRSPVASAALPIPPSEQEGRMASTAAALQGASPALGRQARPHTARRASLLHPSRQRLPR